MRRAFLALVVIGMLLAGCTSPTGNANQTAAAGSGGAQPPANAGAGTGTVSPAGSVAQAGNSQGGAGSSIIGSATYQECVSQCQPGNAGSGPYCVDGCRETEAALTKDTSWCDQLDNKANIPSCYGTVAKTTGDLSICDRFTGTDKDHCVAAIGSTSAG